MKKILILGAGNAQIDAIKYCKKRGYEVHGCSYRNSDPGIPFLDHFIQLDIKDEKSIETYAIKNQIDIVYSIGSDLAIPTAMIVSERCSLPHFISSETAINCQDKYRMRQKLGNNFEGNVAFQTYTTVEEAATHQDFPAMMKPVDSQGQRGCFRVDSADDIRMYFERTKSYSAQKKVIVEKYIDGPEVSANAFFVNGKMIFCIISDRIVFEEFPGGIIKEHMIPTSLSPDLQNKVQKLVENVSKKLNVLEGPFYLQIKIHHETPYIIEAAPRLDGCHMWKLIKHYSEIDLLDMTWSYLIENKVPQICDTTESSKMKLSFFCEAPGKIFSRGKYYYESALYHAWYYQSGDVVKSLNGYMEKCGYQIVRCNKCGCRNEKDEKIF